MEKNNASDNKTTDNDKTNDSTATSEEMPELRLGTRVYKGVYMMQCEAELISTMNTREDDIWVCSYPRSGMMGVFVHIVPLDESMKTFY